ncbi:DNA polymerase III subunit tau,DNA polymerase III subunits gamma and tau,Holliday junction resolvasome, helicase subunit,DNA polymerase III, subunit gamma and tau,ATPase family associated with various cellular activities (AAA) [Chlamydia serpentis]|uniref:DNA polymerase III subunit gamma/tau n=1 Tax=Chlamydia serpentis TaxID=1967782 RepID=A0A2R8F9X1_9CHLA|nr:DNA polymerase III subunit gamma/tau [Chlamydia serpentis]SPN73219.1 DNA polymerase III subunit tau,DNA polymerase III subunits gamma and tau,Holliday junction resolvasome, helicase subunit,DNA polymerase III, subunit gamma and tau,ATPase family associated with various cellular activities (AAA) [Chlamydia serpentis]
MTPSPYQTSSRKYRPQIFREILGQSSVVSVLKNALVLNRLAHAYLFSGIRGTGKTTLARILAKALNCTNLGDDGEPCNQCSSCKEISSGSSLDVLEIDAASHRGIEDIRQINETVLFTPVKAKFKIYIIDEVHMLTKEAFNALLKTLEEPPTHIKFFLATTEIQKIPNTILSRCQKMHLQRIPDTTILKKLSLMAQDNHITSSQEALVPIARAAQGSLRDAESLYDYVVSLLPEILSPEAVSKALGFPAEDTIKILETAIRRADYPTALQTVIELLQSGVAPTVLLHDLTVFYRDLLLKNYKNSEIKEVSSYYTIEQLLEIIDFLGESAKHLQNTIFEQTFLETVIIHIIRVYQRPVLSELITSIKNTQFKNLGNIKEVPRQLVPPSEALIPKTIYKEQNFLKQENQSSIGESKIIAVEGKSSSVVKSATIDTLLQFAVVEFSGILKQ